MSQQSIAALPYIIALAVFVIIALGTLVIGIYQSGDTYGDRAAIRRRRAARKSRLAQA